MAFPHAPALVQDLTLLNPLTYTSEGVRASLVPQVPHMRPWVSAIMLAWPRCC